MSLKGKIKYLYTNANNYGIGDKIIIEFDDDKILLIDEFWVKYLDEKVFLKMKKRFSEIKQFRNMELQSVSVIEGVGTYVLFRKDVIVHLYEEMEDLERMAFYYRIEVVEKSENLKLFQELIRDIEDLGEIVFE